MNTLHTVYSTLQTQAHTTEHICTYTEHCHYQAGCRLKHKQQHNN